MQKTSSQSMLSEHLSKQEQEEIHHNSEEELQQQQEEILDYSTKHPLQTSWTLWYHNPPKGGIDKNASVEAYASHFTQVYTFSYVEDFWSLFNHIKPPTELESGTTYYILKEGIKPEWEDVANIHGGEWMFPFHRKRCHVNDWWLNLAMALIGEFFEDGEIITGACVAVRKTQYRLSVWVGSKDNQQAIVRVGKQFKEALNQGAITGGNNNGKGGLDILAPYNNQFTFDFKTFEDQMKGIKNIIHSIKINEGE
ncbi:hypothetical protein ABK040_002255 [Willaertia magna]